MKPIKFEEHNRVYGKNQPEYIPLPAWASDEGTVVTCWKLSWKNLVKVIFTRRVWMCALTFNQPLQPVRLDTKKPDFGGDL